VAESAARDLAIAAVARRFGLDAARGQIGEISASPAKLAARTDWTFTFRDETLAPLPAGEPRIDVGIAGDEVASVGRYLYVPEEWQRRQRASATRNTILRVMETLIFAGLLVSAAGIGVMAWSRGRYSPRLFVAGAAMTLTFSIAKAANNWPTTLAGLTTAAPLRLQIAGLIALGLVGVALSAGLVGLALGAVPRRLSDSASLDEREALRLGVAGGLFGAAVTAAAWGLRTPTWARVPDVDGAGTVFPMLQAAIDPIPSLLMALAVLIPALLLVDRLTDAWTRRRAAGFAVLAAFGGLAGGVPAGLHVGGWAAGALLAAAALVFVYTTLLRFDLTMVPLVVATMTTVGAVATGIGRPYPGALPGSLGAAVLAMLVGWWWFQALRRPTQKGDTRAA
jgi:hypothetical protein